MKKVFLVASFFVAAMGMSQEVTCPVTGKTASSSESNAYESHGTMNSKSQAAPAEKGSAQINKNKEWWPNQLNLDLLRQNSSMSNPMGADFDYNKEFKN